MFTTILTSLIARAGTWFASSSLKWWAAGIGVVSAISILASVYFTFVGHIRNEAKLEAETARKEEIIKEQQDTIDRQKALMKLQAAFTEKFQSDLEAVEKDKKSVEDYINSPDALKSDRPSSMILKETIKRLK